ncbi:MAG: MarR family transcriptional regulator [Actinomycetota bacterium]|nr:MarR family transcriptional regulator [Actinomycetota bacterium]
MTTTSVRHDPDTAALADQLERVARLVHQHRHAVCARHGLTPPLARALGRLDADRPRAMGELADVLSCDASNVTGIVDRLESKGLVERRPADHDRRAKTVAVTATGQRLARRIKAELATLPSAFDVLDARQRGDLVRLLAGALGTAG